MTIVTSIDLGWHRRKAWSSNLSSGCERAKVPINVVGQGLQGGSSWQGDECSFEVLDVIEEALAEELEFLNCHGLKQLLVSHEALVILLLHWAKCIAVVGLKVLERIEEVLHQRVNLHIINGDCQSNSIMRHIHACQKPSHPTNVLH